MTDSWLNLIPFDCRMRETEELVKNLRAEREELYRRCDALNQQLDKKTAESSAQMLRFQVLNYHLILLN